MRDEFTNRLGMFQTCITTLNSTEHKPAWFQLPPAVFTTKVAGTEAAVAGLREFYRQQGTKLTGTTADKAREEKELAEEAHRLARTLVTWFRDKNDETNAGKVDFSLTQWRQFRDQELLGQARVVVSLTDPIVMSGPPEAGDYGLTSEAVNALKKEAADYEAVLNSPQAAISQRKSLTMQMRNRFNAVEAKFAELDDMVLRFNTTAAGQAMIAAYQAARVVRDLGHGPGEEDPPTPPTPPAQ